MTDLSNLDPTVVTGYAADDKFLATRYTQGNRVVYDFELSLEVIPAILPVPDPNRATPGNRRVKLTHARSFGTYVREQADWVAPGLLLRAPAIFKFEVLKELGGVQFGVLSVPRRARGDIKILDGQHRILGIQTALDDIALELEKQRQLQGKARGQGEPEVEAAFKKEIDKLEGQRARFSNERLAVQIHVETDPERYEQMFYDVAENALGITSAVKVRFDSRKVVNRTLDAMLKHALLDSRVDLEQDRVSGSNPNLMGAKYVVEIVRTVQVGIGGRIGKRLESELDEGAMVQETNDYFDVLLASFPELQEVVDGSLTPEDLRKSSLLGSTTMLRVLAGVYHELRKLGREDEEIEPFFSKLAAHLTAPVPKGSPWLDIHSPVFSEGSTAPTARAQDLRMLTDEITGWETRPPAWL